MIHPSALNDERGDKKGKGGGDKGEPSKKRKAKWVSPTQENLSTLQRAGGIKIGCARATDYSWLGLPHLRPLLFPTSSQSDPAHPVRVVGTDKNIYVLNRFFDDDDDI